MTIQVVTQGHARAAVVESDAVALATVQDALDCIADANHLHDCNCVIFPKEAVDASFFELRSGLAGEVLQKFTNYGMRAAFIGNFSEYESRALRDFIRESNRVGKVLFVPTVEEALARFAETDR